MKHFDVMDEIESHNYGSLMATDVKDAGVVDAWLRRYVADGKLERRCLPGGYLRSRGRR